MRQRLVTFVISSLVALSFFSWQPALATDLAFGRCSGAAPTYCRTPVARAVLVKFRVRNTCNTGGGPFGSTNTIMRIRSAVPPNQSAFYYHENTHVPRRISILDQRRKQSEQEKRIGRDGCVWDGSELRCDLGTVNINEVIDFSFYFTPTEAGQFDLEASLSGDLFDPDNSNNSQTVTLEVIPSQKRLLYPWISNNAGQFESILVLNNLENSPAEVTLTARRREGNPETRMVSVPARGQLRELASSLFPDLGSGGGYSVLAESDTHGLTGGWVTNNLTTNTGASPSQGVAIDLPFEPLPITERLGNQISFNFLPVTNGLTSAPVVLNIGSEAADVVLRFYNSSGDLVAEDAETLRALPPFRPFAAVANTLVPNDSGDVYMVASSATARLSGVAFVFNEAGEPAIGNVSGVISTP